MGNNPSVQKRHHRKKGPAMLLRHIVLFQWKEETPQAKVREIQNTFCALPSKIDVIYDFEWGLDMSVEGLTEGYTHCFQVTFLSEEDRAVYLPHPEHKALIELMKPHKEKVLVLDYWTRA
ncbi:MAG: Dabb family protein [Desulfobacterales bacterium]|jgi:hypothetical protein